MLKTLQYIRSYSMYCRCSIILLGLIVLCASNNAVHQGNFSQRKLEFSSEQQVFEMRVFAKNRMINTTLTDTGHESGIVIVVLLSDGSYELDLQLNRFLFATSYIEKAVGNDNEENININQTRDHCYYTGTVRNISESSAAVSTCTGIMGYFSVGSQMFHILPITNFISTHHKVYITNQGDTPETPVNETAKKRSKRSFIWPQDLDEKTKVVELYIVNDNNQYKSQGSSIQAVTSRAKTIVNMVNSIYQPQDIYIVLVGMEVWTEVNKFNVSTTSSATLDNFLEYRLNYITIPNDNAQFLSSIQYSGNVLGQGIVGSMCKYTASGAIVADLFDTPNVAASTMAHEMGHNFGLIHDIDNCSCTDVTHKCIMYPSDNIMNPATTWSQCSVDQFHELFMHGADYCLYNSPPTIFDPASLCGNGFIETGEQCDCGNAPNTECSNTCCNSATCQLNSGAQCAAGRCCDISTCRIQSFYVTCRAQQDMSCDLVEYCNGTSAICPVDVYRPDGTNCSAAGAPSYCYKGKCSSKESQCQLLWGPKTSPSFSYCYFYLNIGTAYGDCGINWKQNMTHMPCSSNDVMCGRLQCDQNALVLNYYTEYYEISRVMVSHYPCYSVIFDMIDDPGLVPSGSSCDSGKMCVNQKCVFINSLTQPSCSNGCSQHGVCNNLGKCSCDKGFGSDDCNIPVSNNVGSSMASTTTFKTPTTTSIITLATSTKSITLIPSAKSTTTKVTSTYFMKPFSNGSDNHTGLTIVTSMSVTTAGSSDLLFNVLLKCFSWILWLFRAKKTLIIC